MAKKTENKAKEQPEASVLVENVQGPTDTAQEPPTDTQELPATEPENIDEKPSEVLNNDIELADELPELEDLFAESSTEKAQPEEQEPPKEKILFYIRTVNTKTAVRATPEFPMKGDNIVSTIDNKEVHGITDVVNGFGRLAGGAGWVMLDSSVVTRLG